MRRGDVFDARLDPTEGSERAGVRPIVIVSRDAINNASNVIVAVPCTTHRPNRRLYPSQAMIYAPDGGFDVDSVALGEQVRALAKTRLIRRRGSVAPSTLRRIERALLIAMDLPGGA